MSKSNTHLYGVDARTLDDVFILEDRGKELLVETVDPYHPLRKHQSRTVSRLDVVPHHVFYAYDN